jgi:uncharacterized tellurite resistance protein B-like protein
VGILSWLGIRNGDEYPNLDALLKELRRALPDHESVVIRYTAIVVLLLSKVAWADGRFSEGEDEALRGLLAHIDKISPSGVEAVCSAIRGKPLEVNDQELALCYRELKALCDARERMEVMRLLTELAVADGEPTDAERAALHSIADELGLSVAEVTSAVEHAAEEAASATDEAKGDDAHSTEQR